MYKNSLGKKDPLRRIYLLLSSFLFKVISYFHNFACKLLMRTVKVQHDPLCLVRKPLRGAPKVGKGVFAECLPYLITFWPLDRNTCLLDHLSGPQNSQLVESQNKTDQTKRFAWLTHQVEDFLTDWKQHSTLECFAIKKKKNTNPFSLKRGSHS